MLGACWVNNGDKWVSAWVIEPKPFDGLCEFLFRSFWISLSLFWGLEGFLMDPTVKRSPLPDWVCGEKVRLKNADLKP